MKIANYSHQYYNNCSKKIFFHPLVPFMFFVIVNTVREWGVAHAFCPLYFSSYQFKFLLLLYNFTVCRNTIHTKAFVGGGRCTVTTSPQSKHLNRRTLQCHQNEQRIYHLSLHHVLPFQDFCAPISMTQKWSTASGKQFQMSFSASNEPPCATVNGDKGVWFASQDATWLVIEQYWFTFMLLVRPSWNVTKAYFFCEVPLRQTHYLGFALVTLQASTADLPGEKFWRWAQCSTGAPSYLLHAERTDLQANLLSPSLVPWGNICPTQTVCGQASSYLLHPPGTPVPAATSPLNYEPHHSLI